MQGWTKLRTLVRVDFLGSIGKGVPFNSDFGPRVFGSGIDRVPREPFGGERLQPISLMLINHGGVLRNGGSTNTLCHR